MKLLVSLIQSVLLVVFACTCVCASENSEAIPSGSLAEFVVKHLDLNSFLSSITMRQQIGKAHFSDYGYKTAELEPDKVVLKTQLPDSRIELQVLNRNESSITVFLLERLSESDNCEHELQSVLLLHENARGDLSASNETWTVIQMNKPRLNAVRSSRANLTH